MKRENLSSGAPWEEIVGYSRAVKIGQHIEVAGTTAVKNGVLVGENDAAAQTECILQIIDEALKGLGSSLKDVVRTRIFVTNIEDWDKIGKVHGKFFGKIKPACTLVEVSGFVDPKMLLEIEATAIIH